MTAQEVAPLFRRLLPGPDDPLAVDPRERRRERRRRAADRRLELGREPWPNPAPRPDSKTTRRRVGAVFRVLAALSGAS